MVFLNLQATKITVSRLSPIAVVFGMITVPVKHCQSSCWAPSAGAQGWWCCWSRRAAEPGCLPGSRPGPSLSASPWPEGTWEYWLRPTAVKDICTNTASHHHSLRNAWNSYELKHFKRKLDDHYFRKFQSRAQRIAGGFIGRCPLNTAK